MKTCIVITLLCGLIAVYSMITNNCFIYYSNNLPIIYKNSLFIYENIDALKKINIKLLGMQIKTKGYYKANDGGDGLYLIRKKTESDKDNGGSIIFLKNELVAELINEGNNSIRQFGAKGDGISDDTEAFANAIACGKTIYLPKGHYLIKKPLITNRDLCMYGEGDESILDWGDSVPVGHAFDITKSFKKIPGIKDAAKGAIKITFVDAHDLKVGDVFCIANPTSYSWSSFRPYYRAGEMCEVSGVAGRTVYLSNKLFDSYKGEETDIYKLNSRKVYLHDFKIQGTTSQQLLHIYGCKNPVLENMKVYSTEGGYATLVFEKCFGVCGINLDIYLRGSDDNDYGMTLSNCQNVLISGGNFYGRRHGIAIGGTGGKEGWSVINRAIKIKNAVISGVDTYCADMHGCTEYVTYDSCKILHGAVISGSNNKYSNCEIISAKNGVCIYGGEILGGDMNIENCILKSINNPKHVRRGFIDFGGNSNAITNKMKRDVTIRIRNCKLDLQKIYAPDTVVINLINRGATKKINFNINGLAILNTTQKHTVLNVARAETIVEDNSDYIVVDNITGLSKDSVLLNCVDGYLKSIPTRLQSY